MYLLAGLAMLELMMQLHKQSYDAVPAFLVLTLILLAQTLAIVGAWRSLVLPAFYQKLMYLVGMGVALEHLLQHDITYKLMLDDGGLLSIFIALLGYIGIPLTVPFFVLLIVMPDIRRHTRSIW